MLDQLKQAGFNRSCIHYIYTRRRLETPTIEIVKQITEDELIESWLSIMSVINFMKSQQRLP